jgi:hypothetical protein
MIISKVFLFDTGALMVFDEEGNQIEAIQAMPLAAAMHEVMALAGDETQFWISCWMKDQHAASIPSTRERFSLLLERIEGKW